jgi:polyhydroxyalkanoate synthase
MTTEDNAAIAKLDRMTANLAKIEALSARLMAALAQKKPSDPGVQGPGQEMYMKAAAAYLAGMMQNPAKVLEHQVSYWGKTMKHYIEAQRALALGEMKAPEDTGPKDRRFANPLWDTNPAFNYLKQQYLFNAEAVQNAVADMEAIDAGDKKRIEYFSKQIVDMLAPTNFLGTNPDALEKAVETDGESLVRGLENLVADIEANNGEFAVTLADREAFVVGQNIATTPGAVVFRNRMLELLSLIHI